MKMNFAGLFEPAKIGELNIKNRFVMPAMMTRSAENGMVSNLMIDYYAERAKGGVGLIIVEFTKCEVQVEPLMSPYHLSLHIDAHQKSFAALTEKIHKNDCMAALQLSPGLGGWVMRKEKCPPGVLPVGPSTFAGPGQEARKLETWEVETIVRSFGEATLRARKAGFDAIEIHGHSSYLLGQFMSPFINSRDDKYGELWQLPVELLEAAKSYAGSNYPVLFRISGDELVEGGRRIKETIEICRRMEKAGIDCINVSDGTYYKSESNYIFPYMTLPHGTYEPECREIKKAVSVPLILAGRLSYPDDAARVINEGITDFVAIGRGLVADPELPLKLALGKENDIRPCLSCNYCIGSMMMYGSRLKCAVNASVFREKETEIKRVDRPSRVMVIGGGPGGMEAARVAALRGHNVTLYEKTDMLGGNLIAASIPEQKKDIRRIIEWFVLQMPITGVHVVTGKDVSMDMVLDINPDSVILATGARSRLFGNSCTPGPAVVTAIDALLDRAVTGENVLVAGGGLAGCDAALFLADKGKHVTIVEMQDKIASDMCDGDGSRGQILKMLEKKNVICFTGMKLEKISDKGVIIREKDNTERLFVADTVVLALGLEPENDLYAELQDRIPDIQVIGDCVNARKIGDAVMEGFNAAFNLQAKAKKPDFEHGLAYSIMYTARLLRYRWNQLMFKHKFEISIIQWFALNKLYLFGEMNHRDFIKEIFDDRANVARMIASLEKRGLVVRNPDSVDRRKNNIRLTPEGKTLCLDINAVIMDDRELIYHELSQERIEDIKRDLSILNNNILHNINKLSPIENDE